MVESLRQLLIWAWKMKFFKKNYRRLSGQVEGGKGILGKKTA